MSIIPLVKMYLKKYPYGQKNKGLTKEELSEFDCGQSITESKFERVVASYLPENLEVVDILEKHSSKISYLRNNYEKDGYFDINKILLANEALSLLKFDQLLALSEFTKSTAKKIQTASAEEIEARDCCVEEMNLLGFGENYAFNRNGLFNNDDNLALGYLSLKIRNSLDLSKFEDDNQTSAECETTQE